MVIEELNLEIENHKKTKLQFRTGAAGRSLPSSARKPNPKLSGAGDTTVAPFRSAACFTAASSMFAPKDTNE